MKKQCIVIHSGGLDSSLCLHLAIQQFSAEQVLSLSFSYNQRHSNELEQAAKICRDWGVNHYVLNIDCLQEITHNALTDASLTINDRNTLVVGRNGLMARLGAIHADHLGAKTIMLGVIDEDGKVMGYRDCSRHYFNLIEETLRLDLNDPSFQILTPLVHLSKYQTIQMCHQRGILPYLLETTISCYHGNFHPGCQICPTCKIRNSALQKFYDEYPDSVSS